MERVKINHLDAHRSTRRAIAVELRDLEDAVAARHLHVQREARLEAVVPVNLEAEEPDIKLPGLGLVEDAQDGRGLFRFMT